eukprot:3409641-Alexandrium_andersonii.AAC.1
MCIRDSACAIAAAAAIAQLFVAGTHHSVAQLKPVALGRVRTGRRIRFAREPANPKTDFGKP